MSGDVHVQFCERPGVRLPRATHHAAVAAGVQRYLVLAGPSGEHYQEALLMLDDLELRARFDCIFDPRWEDCPPEWRSLRAR